MRSGALLAGLVALALLAAPARALEEGDRAAIRNVIESQIDAFRRDDAAGAYAFAAPSIRRLFPSEDMFLDMVRRGYAPVYRPRRFGFVPAEEVDGVLVQRVEIQDSAGVDWIARYTLERGPDGAWKITGCTLERQPGEST